MKKGADLKETTQHNTIHDNREENSGGGEGDV